MQKHLLKAKNSIQAASLYVVATPIGNLADISLRALAVFDRADIVCAEDTRVTAKLLSAYGLQKKLISVREHNEVSMAEKIIQFLEEGKVVVQVSDAGTPAICDPGARLVRRVREMGFPVYPIPGASALVSALSIAGLDDETFYFDGFLPPKKKERQERLSGFQSIACPIVLYESPHRIMSALADIQLMLPTRMLTFVREITKLHEEALTDTPENMIRLLSEDSNRQRGEMVLIIHGYKKDALSINHDANHILDGLIRHLADIVPTKSLAEILSEVTHENKKALYDMILAEKKNRQ